jgi:hypothetical protein
VRELLYYSYNAPGSIDWIFAERRVELRFHDRSLPRQFFTTWNEWMLLSMKTFEGFTASDELGRILKDLPEFELGEAHQEVDRFLRDYADRKLAAYFSIVDSKADIDLGGYSYRQFYAVYRVMLMKALYHRYQADVNDAYGCIFMPEAELAAMIFDETGIAADAVSNILRDLVFDSNSIRDRIDPAYCSMLREGAPSGRIVMRPNHFSKAEGLVQLLRVVAQRRPNVFLASVSNVLGAGLVRRARSAFEAQGFHCLSEVSLGAIDPRLPDIDLLVIAEEPTLGFVLLVCEVKSPLPPLWARDQLRVLAKDSVSKAFRQAEAIGEFLRKSEGIEFLRSVLPEDGLEHFDQFVTVVWQLIITSDNAGMFFGHEKTPIINFRTLERLLERSDGDVLHIRTCIRSYNEGADHYLQTGVAKFELPGLTVSYEHFIPTTLVDFPKNEWRSSSVRQQMIQDFVAGGHHPFDCLGGHEVIVAASGAAVPDRPKDPSATPT